MLVPVPPFAYLRTDYEVLKNPARSASDRHSAPLFTRFDTDQRRLALAFGESPNKWMVDAKACPIYSDKLVTGFHKGRRVPKVSREFGKTSCQPPHAIALNLFLI
jgi:hypothetical protein